MNRGIWIITHGFTLGLCTNAFGSTHFINFNKPCYHTFVIKISFVINLDRLEDFVIILVSMARTHDKVVVLFVALNSVIKEFVHLF